MANISYGFNQTRPRTKIMLNASGLGGQNVLSEKPLVLLGSANGGQPQTPITLTSYAQAKQILRSGELLDAIEMAWNPSTNVGGAGQIIAVRTDNATQAQLVGGPLLIQSDIYGSDANNIQVQLADNALTSSKTLTVYNNQDGYSKVYDNLGNIFTITYTGTQASGLVTIATDPTTHLATTLTLSTGTLGTETVEKVYQLGSGIYSDVNVMVNDISNLPDWQVTMNTLGGNKNILSQYLDALTATQAKNVTVTVKAVGADIANQTSSDPYINVTYVPGGRKEVDTLTVLTGATTASNVTVTLNGGTPVTVAVAASDSATAVATKIAAGTYTGFTAVASGTTVTFTASAVGATTAAPVFSGGTTGVTGTISQTVSGLGASIVNIPLSFLTGGATSAGPATWSAMFNSVANMGAYYIVPVTSSQAHHGELAAFLDAQATQGNAMRGLVGAGFKETASQLKARQSGLRDARVSLVGDSGTRTMSDGRVYNFPAYMYAALIGGIASGLQVGEPITYKHTNITALDTTFSSDDLDQLNNVGVIMSEFVRTRNGSYFRIVSDPTTYNDIAEPVQNRISLGEVSDFLTQELRTILDEQFIGTRLANTSASILKNAVESYLDQQTKIGGLIVAYNPSDVQVIITGNTATINFTVQPAQGLDYINCFITYQQDQLSA